MPTKLSRLADGLMEACWLGAVLLVPAFFNIYSSRIFEPDKITLLRTLALVIIAAWLIKLFEQRGVKNEFITDHGGGLRGLLRFPLMPLVLTLALVYLISTIFSITPFTSFWGSYQRLQGTYTTYSYLIIFLALLLNVRSRSQIERLISVAILTSLPISLYGILQHYQADPIPWGADVTGRIAANLGNSIFVAAYLIMVFPPTLMRVVELFEALLTNRGATIPNFTRSTIYSFILALQLIAIFFSGSRGPWLGLAASLIVMWLGLSLIWDKRWLTLTVVGAALLAGLFLGALNLPNGPLEGLRSQPTFERLGSLLDPESRTGKVRTLIWQGASELVLPHEPLESPDGEKDRFNILRPLIGYGPEGMYVAYNRFYPPELTQVEKRNASPDRSHNETWDALVITGLFGLTAYLALFGALLYYGLKWLGLVVGKRHRSLYWSLYLLGGLLSSLIFVSWGGVKFLGVALPFGMVLGAVAYLLLVSLFGGLKVSGSYSNSLHAYLLLGLLAALTAHFVEINFGIAIAATRTYFWVYAALLILAGYVLPRLDEPAQSEQPTDQSVRTVGANTPEKQRIRHGGGSTSRRKSPGRRSSSGLTGWLDQLWVRRGILAGLITALLLGTLGYAFISNASRLDTASGLVAASLTQPLSSGGRNGILPLMLTTWLIGVLLLVSQPDVIQPGGEEWKARIWVKEITLAAGLSLLVAFIFWLWDAAGLVSLSRVDAKTIEDLLAQVRSSEGLLASFYLQVFLVLIGLAFMLPHSKSPHSTSSQPISLAMAAGCLLLVLSFASYSNLRVIQADIAFKTGDIFARPGSWLVSISIYKRANNLAPNEDYYYLFLGRAYLEYAKTLDDTPERESIVEQAAADLKRAQEINPLNTDHTANLARLYSLWATFSQDADVRQERGRISSEYFNQAVSLSPKSARLYDEWAVLLLSVLGEPEEAKIRLDKALEIDPYYDWTYALLGDYYIQEEAQTADDQSETRIAALQMAADYYSQALEKGQGIASPDMLFNYAVALGSVRTQLNEIPGAIESYEMALGIMPDSPDSWRIQLTLMQIYMSLGDSSTAIQYAQAAQMTAPADQQEMIANLLNQIEAAP